MTHDPSDNDARIMLQILLTEARRFHSHRPSARRPTSAARSVMESSSSSNASMCSTSSTSTPPPCSLDSPRECDDLYDGWADLQGQIEDAWTNDVASPPSVKYQRIKSYLTCLFIWDPARDWDEFQDASPAASLEWINSRQRARLASLPPGQLFHCS